MKRRALSVFLMLVLSIAFTALSGCAGDGGLVDIASVVSTPTLTPPAGTFSTSQTVTFECGTVDATIKYTTDGTEPSESSLTYSAPLTVSATQTIKVKAFKQLQIPSQISSATYTIAITQTVATPTINPAAGTYLTAQTVTIECSTSGAEIRYATDGSDPTETSTLYSTPFSVSTSQTIKAKAFKSGWTSSSIASAAYTLQLSVSVVDTTGNVGKYSSITLDSSNNPHILYFDLNNKSIKYTYWNGASWQAPATIDPAVGDDGGYCSIAIGSNNKAYASYFDNTNGDLKYATNASGAWVITSVDTAGIVGKYTSITVDKDTNENLITNAAYISYFDVTNQDIKSATNASGPWVTSKIADVGTDYGHSSIAVDSRKKIHISFYNSGDDSLYYATNMSGAFETKKIDSSPSDLGSEAGYNSILSNTIDDPRIAYNGSLKYSYQGGIAWASETIDPAATSPAGMKYISMAKDSNDKLYLGYFDSVNYDLKYATNASGSWQVYTLDSTGIVGRFASIAIDLNNKFHISYYDDTNQQLKYATNKE